MAKEKEKEGKLTVIKDNEGKEHKLNKPTSEEVKQYEEEFKKSVDEFNETKWEISEKGQFGSNDVGMFLQDFMKNWAFWTKTGWMGMIKMDEELKKAMAAADENTGLQLSYQALEFCAYMLANPGKIGLESAFEFEKIADKYAKIGIVIGEKIEEARKILKNIDYLQEKWRAGEQGFYLEELKAAAEDEEEKTKNEDIVIGLDTAKEEKDKK